MSATLAIRAVARPSARRELVQSLLAWAAVARRDEPDLEANACADLESPDAFVLVAHWPSQARLEDHLRSETFGALLGGLDLLARPVQLRIGVPPGDYGADALAAIQRVRHSLPPLPAGLSGGPLPDGRSPRRPQLPPTGS